MEKKDLRHITGEQISLELDEKERECIASMGDWRDSKQLPILTEKIILLTKKIEKLDKNTDRFNTSQIALTVVLVVVAIMQIVISIILSNFGWRSLIIEFTALGIILYFARKIFRDFVPRK